MAQFFLGMNAKLYRNSGTYGTPVWVEVTDVKDLKMTLEAGEGDVNTRGNAGWEAVAPTLKKVSIEFGMVYDPTDTNWTALHTAWLASTPIEFAVADGVIATTGTQYFRATCAILKFDQDEALDGVIHNDVSIKPTRATNAPAWVTAP
jgi:hypothetical protein